MLTAIFPNYIPRKLEEIVFCFSYGESYLHVTICNYGKEVKSGGAEATTIKKKKKQILVALCFLPLFLKYLL